MRKFFSLFAALLFAGSMMADSYTITFKSTESGDGSSSLTSTNVADYITSGAEYVSAISPSGKVYNGQAGYGLKFGNSSGAGAVTMTLATPVAPTSIVMNASPWGANEGAGLLQDSVYDTKSTGAKGTFADFAYEYDGATQITTIIVGTSTKRGYVKSVTVNYGGEPVVTTKYYVAGSMNGWQAAAGKAAWELKANPQGDGDYRGTFTFKANDELKVIGVTGENLSWYPEGTGNNFVVTDSASYDIVFYPAGNPLFDNGYFTLIKNEPVVILPQNCAEIYAKAKGDQAALKDVIVTYVSGKNVWVRDAEENKGSLLLYLSANATWNVGDTLSNVAGEVDIYNGLYELKPSADQAAAVTAKAGEAPAPEVLDALTLADMNRYVSLKQAAVVGEFTTAKATELKMELFGDSIALYNKFKFAYTFEEGALYNVVGIVTVYQNNLQVYFISAEKAVEPQPDDVVYNWSKDPADQVGTTIFGNSDETVGTVKIHNNTDDVDCIKFAKSYVYADGKYIAIKPAEGAFKAGDTLKLAVCFNNSDATKYCMVDVYAADGETRLWRSDSATTINSRTSAADPAIQTYVLAADADSLLLGRYGNTTMCIPFLQVVKGETPAAPVYTVTGGSEPLFGKTWDPAYEANTMEPITGSEYLYAWKKENVALAAGTIEYKVCQDHGWNPAWPQNGNYSFVIAEEGLYDITIFFNPELETPTKVDAEFKGAVVVLPNIILHGNFTGSWADTEAFTPAADSVTASLTLALAEGKYEFGFKFDGAWTANGANLTREANTTNLAEGSGNMFVTADVPGNYIFTYTYATQAVEVTYPNPIIVPDTVVVDAVTYGEVYTEDFEQYGAVDVVLTTQQIVEQRIEGDGFLFFFDIYPEDANNITGNYYVDSLTFDPDYSGIMEIAGADTINYEIVDGAVSFILGQYDIDQKIAQLATIATLEAEDGTVFIISAAAVVHYDFIIPQGVEDVTAEPKKVIKKIEMGNVVIEKNGVRYNINGQMIR